MQERVAMTRPGADSPQWAMVDEGWGRKAVSATLRTSLVTAGSTSLCIIGSASMPETGCSTWRAGPGSAIELARLRGASCSGIDASARLVAVARDRNPECDIRVGDMHALRGRRRR